MAEGRSLKQEQAHAVYGWVVDVTLLSRRTLKRVVIAAAAASALAVALAVTLLTAYMPKTVTVEIINEGTTPDAASFSPSTVNVEPRTTIIWKNTDASAHTVTSTAPAGVFDSGVVGPGEEFELKFESEGTFDYYCMIHPMMVGKVVVQ